MPSFDVVSEVDKHELTNAVDQANRELSTRFDFKGVEAKFVLEDKLITQSAPSDFQLKQMTDILRARLIARQIDAPAGSRVPALGFQSNQLSNLPILPIEEIETSYYLRVPVVDRPGVLAKVATILSERGINIESIMQKEAEEQDGLVPLILLTHRVTEQSMNDAINALEALADVSGPVMRIRVEHLN